MRNIFTIFKNDFRALSRHFLAFTIILAILFLPALYAWFNIYAFWDPYGKTDEINIAVVCNDRDYMDEDGKMNESVNAGFMQTKGFGNEEDEEGGERTEGGGGTEPGNEPAGGADTE